MQRKVSWLLFLGLSVVSDVMLPLLWGLLATIPIVFLSWWVAYRSGWVE